MSIAVSPSARTRPRNSLDICNLLATNERPDTRYAALIHGLDQRLLFINQGAGIERLSQILDQIVNVLEADRQAEQVVRGRRLRPFDRRSMLDQALGPPQTGSPR